MNWNKWEWAILALMIWREARSEGEDGMRAVGHVAWNRAKKSNANLGQVITADSQFTSINPPKKTYDPQLDVWPQLGDKRFESAMTIANEIIQLVSTDPTGGATHYRNPTFANSPSFQKAVEIGELKFTAKIGQHDFYRG